MARRETDPAFLRAAVVRVALAGLLVAACAGPRGTLTATSPATQSPPPTAAISTGPVTIGPDSTTLAPTPGPTLASAAPELDSTPGPIVSARLPVAGSAENVAESIRLAVAQNGRLWVLIPIRGGSVLALLDSNGEPLKGWPVSLTGSSACDNLLAVPDGTVRAICSVDDRDSLDAKPRAYAFAADGRQLPGWPVDVRSNVARIIGFDLVTLGVQYFGDVFTDGQISHEVWVERVHPDGTVASGTHVPLLEDHAPGPWTISPDGIAYYVRHFPEAAWGYTAAVITAIGDAGIRAGWPVALNKNTSEPVFDAAGRLHLTTGPGPTWPTRSLVFDRDGRQLGSSSAALPIESTSTWNGAGDSYPGAPIVATDGTTFVVQTVVVQTGTATTIAALDPSGGPLPGWPYRSDLDLQWLGSCPFGDTGCGFNRSMPVVGPMNVLYVLHAASGSNAGGSIVAVDANGSIRPGWPVRLTRAGSQFWQAIVGDDGTAFALAIEPEGAGRYSATILGIAPDSTVRFATTIMQP